VEPERTQFIPLSAILSSAADDRRHCLELVGGGGIGRRYPVGPAEIVCGRTAPVDIVVDEAGVSRRHCAIMLVGPDLVVTDLGSTNGTYIDGVRIDRATLLRVGGIVRIGSYSFKHELLTPAQLRKSVELERELAAAYGYVEALLPPALETGSITANWVYQPSTRLGGDVFGYGYLADTLFSCYLVDVSGHGAGAAMHGVAVMNALRQRALPGTEMANPAKVLETLNAIFQMDRHADMFFTAWYGVFDTATRTMTYASAGHHPAFAVAPDRSATFAMRTRNALIGAMPGKTYRADAVVLPPGASVYLFSDGVFEIVTAEGREWGLADFLPLLTAPPEAGVTESARLYRTVCAASRSTVLDDDFSLVVLTFD